MALFGPAIRGYKAYKSNKQLKEKLEELKKLSRGSKKKLFKKEEWDKIQSNLEITTLYNLGVINGNQEARQSYYLKKIDNMAKEIQQKKKELEKANAKKIDIARLGLSIQKLAQELDNFESQQSEKIETSIDETNQKIDKRIENAKEEVAKDIKNLSVEQTKIQKVFIDTKNGLNKDLKSLKKQIESGLNKVDEEFSQTNSTIKKIRVDLNDVERRHNKIRFKVDQQGKEIVQNQNNIKQLIDKVTNVIKFGVIISVMFLVILMAINFL